MWITPGVTARLIFVRRVSGLWKIALVALLSAADIPAVDPYQPYVPKNVANCSDANFAEQPGVVEFKDLIVTRIGGASWGIFACSGYEHEEGRAWDWRMNVNDPTELAGVQRVLGWLVSNENEMARRLGLAYLIWNDQYLGFSAGENHAWEDYLACIPGQSSASVCHMNHVHFSFAWAGARRETTWFTTGPRPAEWYPDYSPMPAGPPTPVEPPAPTETPAPVEPPSPVSTPTSVATPTPAQTPPPAAG